MKLKKPHKQKHHTKHMQLYDYQETHKENLLNYLDDYNIAIDCSKTGSGKTFVAISVSNTLKKDVIILCPPTLMNYWKENCDQYLETKNYQIISSGILKKKYNDTDYFLIVDECHQYKNNSSRHKFLKKMIKNSSKTLLMSATPMDAARQECVFESLLEGVSNKLFKTDENGVSLGKVQLCSSSMNFNYKTSITYNLYHNKLEDELNVMYKKGYQKTYPIARDGLFSPGMFQNGIKLIHDSLFGSLVEGIKKHREKYVGYKYIIIIYFNKHVQALLEHFPFALTLNGSTPQTERNDIISKFQQDDYEYPMLITSSAVGGVGIEFDDKTGKYPRCMFLLPTTNAIQFIQTVGRIQRTHTKSNSSVYIIQPMRVHTYFKKQMESKLKVLDIFNKQPKLKIRVAEHECCDGCDCEKL